MNGESIVPRLGSYAKSGRTPLAPVANSERRPQSSPCLAGDVTVIHLDNQMDIQMGNRSVHAGVGSIIVLRLLLLGPAADEG